MSLTSFLTQSPMNYAQGMSQTSSQLPSWYNDYTQGILANAAQFANQGYQQYQGPQVAGLTPDQQASYNTVRGANQGVTGAAAGTNQANNALAGPNASQAANPYLAAAQSGINKAVNGPNALSASTPYAQAAGTPLASQMSQFMNPYISNVVNASNQLSAQNFNQNVLPALQDQFTRAGQVYGGSQQGLYAQRLGAQENLNEQMTDASLLASGYNTALGGAEAQSNINAGLANTQANAANAAQGNSLYGAGLTAGLGSTAGSLANASQQTGLSGANVLGNLGTMGEAAALGQANAQNQMGTQQQQQTQNNYSTQYQNFLNQTNWPMTAASAMGSALQGIQVPTGSTNYSYQPYGVSNSPLTTGLSTAGSIASLLNQLGIVGNAKGGVIRNKLAAGGRPAHVNYLPSVRPTLGLKMRFRSPLLAR